MPTYNEISERCFLRLQCGGLICSKGATQLWAVRRDQARSCLATADAIDGKTFWEQRHSVSRDALTGGVAIRLAERSRNGLEADRASNPESCKAPASSA